MRHTRLLTSLALAACATSLFAQTATNHKKLKEISDKARVTAEAKKKDALARAAKIGIPTKKIENGRVRELMEFRANKPAYYLTDNANAAISSRANRVHPGGAAGLNLTGSGVTFGHWDGGTVRTTHQEYAGRIVLGDAEPRSGDHASHVAGTLIASGVNPAAKGMSFQGIDQSYGWNSDTSEMAAAGSAGIRITNHSYGFITGWYFNGLQWYWYGDTTVSTTEDVGFGMYDATAQEWDTVAYNAPFMLICKSSGNDRGEGPAPGTSHQVFDPNLQTWVTSTATRDRDGGTSGYDTVSWHGTAKNIMTVGAVNDVLNYTGPGSVTMTSFSGWGPTDDGRIKPDIVGNGAGLTSSLGGANNTYGSFSGTSMSTPNVAGSMGLLVHHFRNLNAGADMRAATLKGLVIHSADECGAATGPDYINGWGLINTERGAQVITQDSTQADTITEATLSSGQTSTFAVSSNGSGPLRVTLSWTDPAGPVAPYMLDPSTSNLVNDLDLRVLGPGGTSMPYILNPASPTSAATTGDNFRDNVEQVYIASPAAGTYTIQVTHKGVSLAPSGSQAYSVIVTGQSAGAGPAELTAFTLSANTVGGGNSVTGTVTLSNNTGGTVNLSSNNGAATVPATVTVPSGSTSANFTVTTNAVAATTNVALTASRNAVTLNQNLQVQAAQLTSVSVSPSTVIGGNGSTGTVNVSGNVPAGGIVIALSDDNANVTTPSSVTVPGGASSATFAITTVAVGASQTATITAVFESNTRTTTLTVNPASALNTLGISPSSVFERNNTTGTVTLTSAAGAGGVVVSLSELGGTSSLILPASVTVLQGNTSASFTIGTNNIGSSAVTRTVQASYNGVNRTATVTINPITVTNLTLNPSTVKAGNSSTGTVTINAAAGVGGAVVNLSSSNTAWATVPATVTVAQGATTATFTINTIPSGRRRTVTITASRNGTSRTATLTIQK